MNIRRARDNDLPALVDLCAEHAAFEGAQYERAQKIEKLREALGRDETLLSWVAEGTGDGLSGYATATIDFSTWRAEKFMHLDCLFIKAGARGKGIGYRLFEAALEEAAQRGIHEMQWQTPDWNLQADKFYRRLGAVVTSKLRYTLPVYSVRASDQGVTTP